MYPRELFMNLLLCMVTMFIYCRCPYRCTTSKNRSLVKTGYKWKTASEKTLVDSDFPFMSLDFNKRYTRFLRDLKILLLAYILCLHIFVYLTFYHLYILCIFYLILHLIRQFYDEE
jgi:hypothetical protein